MKRGRQPQTMKKRRTVSKNTDPQDSPTGSSANELHEWMCKVCFTARSSADFPRTRLTCAHSCCRECLESYFKERVSSGFTNIACPWSGCDQTFSPADINTILNDPRWKEQYSRLSLTKALLRNPETRFCPGVECEYAVFVPAGVQCPVLLCENASCGVRFCCQCSEIWSGEHECREDERLPDTKRCPGCKVPVHKVRNGSCNQVTCRVCGYSFCWLCLKELGYSYVDHYGINCPLYGKKRFGLARQMLNRVTYVSKMALGIPLAVGLIAGAAITVSAVTTAAGAVSSPVFLARELAKREKARESSTKRQRLALTGGAAVGALGMPLLAPWGIYLTYRKLFKKVWEVIAEYGERELQDVLEERQRENLQ